MNLHSLSKLIGREAERIDLPFTARYPRNRVRREVLKGALGAAVCLGVLILLRPTPWLGWPIGLVAALFGLYLGQQARRFSLRLEVDTSGVSRERSGRREVLHWAELADLRCNYFPDGRKATMGTLELVLSGRVAGGGSLRLKADSTLDHFPSLLAEAARVARERKLELHPTTVDNLEKLGL